MTDAPATPARVSKSALLSLICGILGCIPFVTGALAVLLGLIGFFMAGKPGMKGRWMAIVGALLGVISIGVWTVGGVASIAWIWTKGASQFVDASAPGVMAHDFIKDLTAGDTAAAKALAPGFEDAALGRIRDYCKAQGTFVDTSFNTNIDNDSAHLEGTVKFSSGEHPCTVDLEQANGKWQVTQIDIKPQAP